MHCSALYHSDNTPACAWVTQMSPKSKISAGLVRVPALRQHIFQDPPMYTIHVAGKANDMSDIPSRSFRLGHCWHFPSDVEFLTRFNQRFPLPQRVEWQLFRVSPRIITCVIDKLLIQLSKMDVWHRLPTIGCLFGENGVQMCTPAGSTSTFSVSPLAPSSKFSLVLLDRLGRHISLEAIAGLVRGSKEQLGPSAKPASWTSVTTPSTDPQENI